MTKFKIGDKVKYNRHKFTIRAINIENGGQTVYSVKEHPSLDFYEYELRLIHRPIDFLGGY